MPHRRGRHVADFVVQATCRRSRRRTGRARSGCRVQSAQDAPGRNPPVFRGRRGGMIRRRQRLPQGWPPGRRSDRPDPPARYAGEPADPRPATVAVDLTGWARTARLSKPPQDAPMPNRRRPSMKRFRAVLAPAVEHDAEQAAGAGHVALPQSVAGVAGESRIENPGDFRPCRQPGRNGERRCSGAARAGQRASAGRAGRA